MDEFLHTRAAVTAPLLYLLLLTGVWACEEAPPQAPDLAQFQQAEELGTDEELADAFGLFARAAVEQFTFATDPLERGETLIFPSTLEELSALEAYEDVFNLGDEAFESERDRVFGLGLGELPPLPLPRPNQRLQVGELGGVDSTSCRSCHFAGGPDGGGTLTQVGLFRSDGQHLSTASSREPPHVMGLGYISIIARHIEQEFRQHILFITLIADADNEPFETVLEYQGIVFAEVTVFPGGDFELADTTHITDDLKIRPFGFKGRHSTLVELIDEALQLHHGLQSTARTEVYADQAEVYLGDGTDSFDPDNDGLQSEVTPAQSMLLASYLSMLPVPRIRVPDDPELALIWARGQRLFNEVDCHTCHVPALRLFDHDTQIEALGSSDLSYTIDLEEHGIDPKPVNVDFSPLEGDEIPVGIPIFAFTDLRRHDMGEALAEPVAEVLPDGGGEIPGSVWLTRSLWGLADTAPYLHDGRAPTVHDAIVWHGGEAQESREAYLALDEEEQGALRVFLLSLTRDGALLVE